MLPSKISKFADDTILRHRARKPDDITVLQEDINKLVELPNKSRMNFNIDKCPVMHIGHNNIQGIYNMSNQQLPTTRAVTSAATFIIAMTSAPAIQN